jgi:hypothetical protein
MFALTIEDAEMLFGALVSAPGFLSDVIEQAEELAVDVAPYQFAKRFLTETPVTLMSRDGQCLDASAAARVVFGCVMPCSECSHCWRREKETARAYELGTSRLFMRVIG